jgi:hypothetical protein
LQSTKIASRLMRHPPLAEMLQACKQDKQVNGRTLDYLVASPIRQVEKYAEKLGVFPSLSQSVYLLRTSPFSFFVFS